METYTCRVCGSIDAHPSYSAREMMFGTREAFDYFQCRDCACLQIATVPGDLGRHYPGNYYSFTQEVEAGDSPSLLQAWLRWLRARNAINGYGFKLSRLAGWLVEVPRECMIVRPVLQEVGVLPFGARFLDVGCGSTSWWLRALSQLGFRHLLGVDPYAPADRREGVVQIRRARLEEVEGVFDVITFHHSLEHVEGQVELLSAARQRIAPGGVCVVRIPVVDSDVWREYGTDWVELDAPRHLFLHSRRSLARAAERAGLRVEKVVCDSEAFEYWGSEQYRRGIPLMAPTSFLVAPGESEFTYKEIAAFERRAEAMNRAGQGGRAAFYLRAA